MTDSEGGPRKVIYKDIATGTWQVKYRDRSPPPYQGFERNEEACLVPFSGVGTGIGSGVSVRHRLRPRRPADPRTGGASTRPRAFQAVEADRQSAASSQYSFMAVPPTFPKPSNRVRMCRGTSGCMCAECDTRDALEQFERNRYTPPPPLHPTSSHTPHHTFLFTPYLTPIPTCCSAACLVLLVARHCFVVALHRPVTLSCHT